MVENFKMFKKRISNSESGPWLPYIIGDCKALDDILVKKMGLFWQCVKFLNALFRGVGQVVFANNPWSGLIILLCLYWADPIVGFATTLAASTAIITSLVFKQDEKKISAGLTTYNAVLVGSVTSSLWTPSYHEPITFKIWGFIILAAALSVLVNAALANILGSFKPTLPSFTFAFNIVTILLFTTVQPRPTSSSRSEKGSIILNLIQSHGRDSKEVPIQHDVLLTGILQGILLSMGQVYAVNCLLASVVMYFATLLYSPLVCIMSFVGATVGTLFGIVFTEAPYDNVYMGIWGFNAILAAIAVGALFFVPSPLSFAVALGDVALVVLVQQALSLAFTPLNLPFLTFPFVISSILFLEITATGDYLTRVSKFSFPEMHLYEFYQMKNEKNKMNMRKLDESLLKPSAPPLDSVVIEGNQNPYFQPSEKYYSQNYFPLPIYNQNVHLEETMPNPLLSMRRR